MEPIILQEIKELPIDKQIEALEGLDWLSIDASVYGLCFMLSLRFKVEIYNLYNSKLFTNPEYSELAVLIPTFNRAKAMEFLRTNYPTDVYRKCLNSYWFSRGIVGDKQRKEFIEYLIKDLKAKQNGRARG